MVRLKIKEIILCALFIALITAGTFIKIPVGADVYTLQFLFTLLAGLILGAKLGTFAVGTYVIMGLIGVPVFAMGGGLGYILQPTFGYLIGFVLQAWFCGKYVRRLEQLSFLKVLGVNVAGMVIVYLIGISWFYVISNYVIEAPIAAWAAIFYCGILQFPPDLLLCIVAARLSIRCHNAGIWLEQENNFVENSQIEEQV